MTSGGIGGEVVALDVMFRGSFERDDGREETCLHPSLQLHLSLFAIVAHCSDMSSNISSNGAAER
jgi:hypothetical protein